MLNSLYGRFGMDDKFSNIDVIHIDYINDFENKFWDLISDRVELGDSVLIQLKSQKK